MLQSVLVLGSIPDVDGDDEDGLNDGNVEVVGLRYSLPQEVHALLAYLGEGADVQL